MANPLVLPVANDSDQSSFVNVITLPTGVFTFTWTWRVRQAGWYVSIVEDSTGTTLLSGARLCPGLALFGSRLATSGFVGFLFCKGVDEYTRADLFTGKLRVLYMTAAELAAFVATADPVDTLTVTVGVPV